MGFKQFYNEGHESIIPYDVISHGGHYQHASFYVEDVEYFVNISNKGSNYFEVNCGYREKNAYENTSVPQPPITDAERKKQRKEMEDKEKEMYVSPSLFETVKRIVMDFLNTKISEHNFNGLCFDMTNIGRVPMYSQLIDIIQNSTYLNTATMEEDDSMVTLTRD